MVGKPDKSEGVLKKHHCVNKEEGEWKFKRNQNAALKIPDSCITHCKINN